MATDDLQLMQDERIEQQYEEAQKAFDIEFYTHQVKLYEALKRLEENKDFQFLIEQSFLDKHLKDTVSQLPNLSSEASYNLASKAIHSVGYLDSWLRIIANTGQSAKESLDELYKG